MKKLQSHFFKDSFQNIQINAVKNNRDSTPKKDIKLLNALVLIAMSFGITLIIIDIIRYGKLTPNLIGHLNLLGMYFATLFLNYRGFFKIAACFFIFYLIFGFYLFASILTPNIFAEFNLMVIPCIALMLFRKLFIPIASLIVSFIAFAIVLLYYVNYENKAHFPEYIVLFTSLFVIVNYFKANNLKNEKLLKEEKIIITKQTEELKSLNEFKSHFFVNLSHDIRTPLTLIKGHVGYLKGKNIDIQVLEEQTLHIQHIIDNILDLSALDTNEFPINKHDVNLTSLMKKIYSKFKYSFDNKGVRFILNALDANIIIKADKTLMEKAIGNIITNALKFTPRDKQVILEFTLSSTINIRVIDTGIGIDLVDSKKIFSRFYQSKNNINQTSGSGIGLSITKEIIDIHGYNIKLCNDLDEGSCFEISIPEGMFLIKESTLEPSKPLKKELKKKYTLLIVEDHDEMRSYLINILKKNYHILYAKEGKEAIETIKANKVDFLVTDYMMPIMDGLELVEQLKKQNIQLPTLVITARQDVKGKIEMLRLGVDAYISKPFEEEELQLVIANCIKNDIRRIKFLKENLEDKTNIRPKREDEVLSKTRRCIEKHISNPNFSVTLLAESLFMTERTLHRKIKSVTGCTPKEIIQDYKFKKAIEFYKNEKFDSLNELSMAVGYKNPNYFAKKVKEQLGVELKFP